MSANPTIVLVHGFWGDAAHWAKVIVELNKRGYDRLRAVENPLTSLADDVARTKQLIAQIDGPVLLAGHSYGGAVISAAGTLPNVAGLVYIAAFAPDTGDSLASLSADYPAAGGANIAPDSDGYLWIRPDRFHESFAQDLPADEALVMAVTQKAPVGTTYGDPLDGEPAWRTTPSWYQLSTADRMIAPANQRRMAERIGARKIVELAASHASLASQPGPVTDLIAEAANAVSGS